MANRDLCTECARPLTRSSDWTKMECTACGYSEPFEPTPFLPGVSLVEHALKPVVLHALDSLVKDYKAQPTESDARLLMAYAEKFGVAEQLKTAERFVEWFEAQLTRPVVAPTMPTPPPLRTSIR